MTLGCQGILEWLLIYRRIQFERNQDTKHWGSIILH